MADQLQLRGGTTAEHASFTGALREITVDTDKDTVVVHDNATVGGHPLQKQYPALGSAAAPTYTFTGDTNTGIYSPGADQVAISTNGTGRLFVDSSGHLGLGTSSPTNLLTVYGTGTDTTPIVCLQSGNEASTFNNGAQIAFGYNGTATYQHLVHTRHNASASGNAIDFYVCNGTQNNTVTSGSTHVMSLVDGRVGIGTTSPGSALEVNATAPVVTINSAAANASSIEFKQAGTLYGRVRFDGNDFDIGNLYSGGATIINAGNAERARIDSSGRLLVGTSSASGNNLLQVTTDALINGITVGKGASSIGTNIAIGVSALNAVTTGNETIAVGHTAGASLTTGTRNVFIGYKAGNHDTGTLTTGSQCIFAGAYARPSAVGSQREHVFGYDIVGKGNSTTFIDNACYQGNNSASWTTTSDQRLKKNITDNLEGLEKINQIRVVNFEYRPEEEIEDESLRPQAIVKEGVQLGVIAQELQKVCPECVIEQSTGVLSVIDDNIFWHMVNAVKELSAQNAALETRLAALEAS